MGDKMDYMYIGRVANTHGVRGDIKVFPTTDDKKRFEKLKKITIEDARGNDAEYHIIGIKYVNKFVVLNLKEIEDMDSALRLKQGIVKIDKKYALPLEKDEYYVQDLVGLEVVDEDENKLGMLREVLHTGSNDVYIIDLEDGGEVLIPAIKKCILKINMKKRVMKVHVLEGLM